MSRPLTRKSLLARGGTAGAALFFAGVPAALAAAPPDNDLAFARLLIGVELLAADFYGNAIAAARFGRDGTVDLKRALGDEQQHYALVSTILTNAGQTPATADDIDFSYPKGSFDSRNSIVKLGIHLETISLGAYLGAIAGYQTNAFKLPAAQIAANEASHRTVFTTLTHGQRIGPAFADPMTIDRVSDALDAFTA